MSMFSNIVFNLPAYDVTFRLDVIRVLIGICEGRSCAVRVGDRVNAAVACAKDILDKAGVQFDVIHSEFGLNHEIIRLVRINNRCAARLMDLCWSEKIANNLR